MRDHTPQGSSGRHGPYVWLLVDADGTLFDFDRAEAAALRMAPRQLGYAIPPDFVEAYHAINTELWRQVERGELPAGKVRRMRFEQLFSSLQIAGDPEAFSQTFLRLLVRKTRFLPGASSVLARLRGRVGLVLLTNGFADVQRDRLVRLGLGQTFDHVVISEEVGAAKPDRAIFEAAFRQMGFPDPASVLLVGDSLESDIQGGVRYGVDTCWFNPRHRANATSVEPTYEIDRLSQLEPLVFGQARAAGREASPSA